MEDFLTIKTDDGHLIYGTLNFQEMNKKEKLVIFVHGLTGSQNEQHYFNAVPFLNGRGFDTFRFNFYSRADKARQLSESPLRVNVEDLNKVIDNFKDDYKEIFLVGHSFGCLAILGSDLSKISKIVLWDPASGFTSLEDKRIVEDKANDRYILRWGKEIIISKELLDDFKKSGDLESYIKRAVVPCAFIFAEKGRKYEKWKPFLGKHRFYVVEGATHNFIEEGASLELYRETLIFLKE